MDYFAKMFEQFNKSRIDEEFCDATLKLSNSKFPVHRLVLASASEYFRVLFTKDFENLDLNDIKLIDVTTLGLQTCLDYIYYGKVDFNREDLEQVLHAACLFQLWGLKEFCFDKMEMDISVGNCLECWKLSKEFNSDLFETKVFDFIEKNIAKILHKSDEFCEMNEEFVGKCLQIENKSFADEVILCQALFRWIEYKKNERKHLFCELFQFIRLPFMSGAFLAENVANNSLIKDCRLCNEYLTQSMLYRMAPSMHNKLKNYQLRERGSVDTEYCKSPSAKSQKIAHAKINKFVAKQNLWNKLLYIQCSTGNHQYDFKEDSDEFRRKEHRVSYNTSAFCTINSNIYYFYENGKQLLSLNAVDRKNLNFKKFGYSVGYNKERFALAATEDRVYLFGGKASGNYYPKTLFFDLKNKHWGEKQSLIINRCDMASCIMGNYIYAIGGVNSDCMNCREDELLAVPSVERMDYKDDNSSWELVNQLRVARSIYIRDQRCVKSNCVARALKNRIYVFGGDGSNSMEFYDGESWTLIKQRSKAPDSYNGVFVVNDKIYLVGGRRENCGVEEWNEEENVWKVTSDISKNVRYNGPVTVAFAVDKILNDDS